MKRRSLLLAATALTALPALGQAEVTFAPIAVATTDAAKREKYRDCIPDMIRNGAADVYIDTMIKGHPTITEVALTTPVTFLDLPDGIAAHANDLGLEIGTYGPWFEGQTAAA
ncbi:MAG: hypothetical protein EBT13_08820, partial [Rhodobacteraceae bacterium]|nr:hypothetical protein [Paracoccaceae bacterium]